MMTRQVQQRIHGELALNLYRSIDQGGHGAKDGRKKGCDHGHDQAVLSAAIMPRLRASPVPAQAKADQWSQTGRVEGKDHRTTIGAYRKM